ncbi:MAG: shikimate kinase [Synechococcales cyanobacterium RM1_1_8]|nr:shikimate kinase [Synechococcales cyanobacterium RM1_1_8]
MKDLLQGINIYFVGMMGVGKSTIGRLVAKELGYQFFDTDTLIEQVAKRSIKEIFAQEGEVAFRELESQSLAELSAYQGLVIATGGGIVTRRGNWSHLQQGLVIWLDVPLEMLYQRLKRDRTRPLLQTENSKATLRQLLEVRRPLYGEADLRVVPQPRASTQETAQQVLRAIPSVLKTRPSQPPWPAVSPESGD